MRRIDVLGYWGGSVAKTASALGITPSAVYQWPETVPERIAYRAQEMSHGALTVDPAIYAKRDRAIARKRRPKAA